MRKKVKNYLLYLLTGLMVLISPMTALAEGTANYFFGCGEGFRSAPVSYEVDKVYHAGDIEEWITLTIWLPCSSQMILSMWRRPMRF